jgi:pyruvate dehydrogenase E2 component (dihydrolipoamide acetyltransferase)
VDSDKASFEVEAFESGIVLKLLYQEGAEAKVFEPIAYIGAENEKIEDIDGASDEKQAAPESEESVGKTGAPAALPQQESSIPARIFASPVARRIAKTYALDLSAIAGSGPMGRIIKRDVIGLVSPSNGPEPKAPAVAPMLSRQLDLPPAADRDEEVPFNKIRQKIAERLTQSKQSIPHFYLFMDVDLTLAMTWRAAYNQSTQQKITVNDVLLKVVAATLRKYPQLNSHVNENKLIIRKDINIGIAVSVDDGLLVPVIPQADKLGIQEISRLTRENAEGARRGTLKVQSVGTFTISNLGMYGINSVLPIINPPESAILGVGGIEKRVVPLDNNAFGVREIMTVTLACDHRAVDGTYGARFLQDVKAYLENFTV